MKCERCSEDGIGHNEDGVFLCEDCLFEEQCQANGLGPDERQHGDDWMDQ